MKIAFRALTVVISWIPSILFSADGEMPVYELPGMPVSTAGEPGITLGLDPSSKAFGPGLAASVDLAQTLASIPGVDFASRGAKAIEPIIRGFALDRISTRFNGLPLFNSTPTRTGAPINFFGPGSLDDLNLEGGLLSVSKGPVTIGPRLLLESFGSSTAYGSQLAVRAFSNGGGLQAEGRRSGQVGPLDYRFSAHHVDMGDYTAGDGREVSAAYKAWSTGLALRGSWNDRHVLEFTVHTFRQALARNSALPLDTQDTQFWAATLNYQLKSGANLWKARLGGAQTRPFMTSADRPLPSATPIASITNHAETRSLSAGVSMERGLADLGTIEIGLDAERWERDALRTRNLKSGAVLTDRIWPDVLSEDIGLFAEARGTASSNLSWRLGARLDHIASEARATVSKVLGVPGALGLTVEDNYRAFHGSAASGARQADTVGALNFLLAKPLGGDWSIHGGIGYSVAPAGVSEKYRAFLNALGGGVELGNPTLAPERKTELALGLRKTSDHFSLHAEFFAASIDDYVSRQIIADTGPIFSYRNRSAEFWGGELSGRWTPNGAVNNGFSLPFQFSAVHGEDRSTGKRLPEIAPWQASLAAQWQGTIREFQYSAQVGAKLIGAQTNPSPVENPLYADTAGATLWHARASVKTPWDLTFEVALENAFDRLAYAYLNPPVATGIVPPASGDLKPGERIPVQGRSLNVALRWEF